MAVVSMKRRYYSTKYRYQVAFYLVDIDFNVRIAKFEAADLIWWRK